LFSIQQTSTICLNSLYKSQIQNNNNNNNKTTAAAATTTAAKKQQQKTTTTKDGQIKRVTLSLTCTTNEGFCPKVMHNLTLHAILLFK
jgi:hypothetical protein